MVRVETRQNVLLQRCFFLVRLRQQVVSRRLVDDKLGDLAANLSYRLAVNSDLDGLFVAKLNDCLMYFQSRVRF